MKASSTVSNQAVIICIKINTYRQTIEIYTQLLKPSIIFTFHFPHDRERSKDFAIVLWGKRSSAHIWSYESDGGRVESLNNDNTNACNVVVIKKFVLVWLCITICKDNWKWVTTITQSQKQKNDIKKTKNTGAYVWQDENDVRDLIAHNSLLQLRTCTVPRPYNHFKSCFGCFDL